MGDLEQRVYIVQVNLPKLEDLDRIGVQRRYIDSCNTGAEKEEFIISKRLFPGKLNSCLTYFVL